MKRPSKRTATGKKPPGNPHDLFARKTMGDPLIAADLLRHYTDPVVGKYVDLDSLKPEPTQSFGKRFQELVKDIAFASHLIDKKGKADEPYYCRTQVETGAVCAVATVGVSGAVVVQALEGCRETAIDKCRCLF